MSVSLVLFRLSICWQTPPISVCAPENTSHTATAVNCVDSRLWRDRMKLVPGHVCLDVFVAWGNVLAGWSASLHPAAARKGSLAAPSVPLNPPASFLRANRVDIQSWAIRAMRRERGCSRRGLPTLLLVTYTLIRILSRLRACRCGIPRRNLQNSVTITFQRGGNERLQPRCT